MLASLLAVLVRVLTNVGIRGIAKRLPLLADDIGGRGRLDHCRVPLGRLRRCGGWLPGCVAIACAPVAEVGARRPGNLPDSLTGTVRWRDQGSRGCPRIAQIVGSGLEALLLLRQLPAAAGAGLPWLGSVLSDVHDIHYVVAAVSVVGGIPSRLPVAPVNLVAVPVEIIVQP